jgi:hypothetical protein
MVFKWAIFQSEEKLLERLEKAKLDVIMTNPPAWDHRGLWTATSGLR